MFSAVAFDTLIQSPAPSAHQLLAANETDRFSARDSQLNPPTEESSGSAKLLETLEQAARGSHVSQRWFVSVQATVIAALTLFKEKLQAREIRSDDAIMSLARWHGKVASAAELDALCQTVANASISDAGAGWLPKDPHVLDTALAALRCYQQEMRLQGGMPPAKVAALARAAGKSMRMIDIDSLCERLMVDLVNSTTPEPIGASNTATPSPRPRAASVSI